MNDRNFKGVWIPKQIWECPTLTLQEKVFFTEIESLDNEEGCFASNGYFADFFGLSKTRVSLVIKSLIEKKYITSLIIYREGTKEILKRVLKVCYIGYITKVKDPTQGKLKDNNTVNNTVNNTYNNTINIYTLERELFDYWNIKKGTVTSTENSFDTNKIATAIKNFKKEEIVKAIDRLDKAVIDTNYYYNFKWNIYKFFKQANGISNWLDDGQLWNDYKSKGEGTSNGGTRKYNGTSKEKSSTESEGDRLSRRASEKYGTNVENIECDF
jgi:hypothetical protein